MKGINRASVSSYELTIYKNNQDKQNKMSCVFISHRSTDMEAANEVAKYLMENGIDVYLDNYDKKLKKASKEANADEIVKIINEALACSSDILVLVTDKTKESWWVPYEVGYAKKGNKKIASAILKDNIIDFPDYLKIEKTIKNPNAFKDYVVELKGRDKRYDSLFEKATEPQNLNNYIRSIL